MATILNLLNCASGVGNTGILNCALDPALIKGGFLVPASFELSAADLATPEALQAALAAAILAAPALRIYPLPPFEAVTDSSEDVTTQTLGYGAPVTIREGKYQWIFQYRSGGVCLNNQLRKFNGKGYRALFIDATGIVLGTKNSDGTGLKGIPLVDFYTEPWKVNDGSNITSYRLKFVFDPGYINDNVAFVQYEPALELQGLQNVYLAKISRTAGVAHISATVGCGGDNLHDLYASELADPSLWIVRNPATGALVTVTAVADDTVNGGWTVTVDATDTDYVATALLYSLAAPSVLAAAGIDGYESNVVSIAP